MFSVNFITNFTDPLQSYVCALYLKYLKNADANSSNKTMFKIIK